jgi:hypothetical protein
MSDNTQPPDCIHAGRVVRPDRVECSSNRFAGPDFAVRSISKVCNHPCPFRNKPNREMPVRGLGDLIAAVLGRLGFEKRAGCGCGQRQHWLNKIFPLGQPGDQVKPDPPGSPG